jgi:periplasmic divalent cation tolerance protein
MNNHLVVLSTVASRDEAERVARRLLEARVAACVNLIPQIRSLYWWQGTIEDSEETLLLIKTSRELFAKLKAELEAAHSYEVPEVIALPIEAGSEKYLSWLAGELGTARG